MKDHYCKVKVEHLWIEEHERWIYIEYNKENDIIGLNFMQGDEYDEYDYDEFIKGECYNDNNLTVFYHHMRLFYSHEFDNITDIDFINKVISSRNLLMGLIEAETNEFIYNYELKEE